MHRPVLHSHPLIGLLSERSVVLRVLDELHHCIDVRPVLVKQVFLALSLVLDLQHLRRHKTLVNAGGLEVVVRRWLSGLLIGGRLLISRLLEARLLVPRLL